MRMTDNYAGKHFSPLYFLAALGLGGASVSFFMYLMFWVPHPGQPVPVFEDIVRAFAGGGLALQAAIGAAITGIALFSVLYVSMLVWNLRQFAAFRKTGQYMALRSGNAETQLMAVPLTLAMGINAGFIVGLVFVPGLWNIVEYLFPLAIAAFLAVGIYALAIMGNFFGRVMVNGGFDCAKNNSFAQLLPAFAFAMVGVGLAAPAAMSTNMTTVAIAYMASTFFVMASAILAAANLVLGLRSMMENGVDDQSAPTLWVLIPVLTVIGIATMRQDHGLHTQFGEHAGQAANFTMLTGLVAVQLLFGLLGYRILREKRYFARYVFGQERSAGSYALVCPGIALTVLGHFFVNKGLVTAGIIAKFGMAYWSLTALLLVLQFATIALIFRLNGTHFSRGPSQAASLPAE